MPIDTFTLTHNGSEREIVAEQITFRKDGDTAEAIVFANHRPAVANEALATGQARIADRRFAQSEIVTAAKQIADAASITITPAQLGAIILGLPRRLIENRFAD